MYQQLTRKDNSALTIWLWADLQDVADIKCSPNREGCLRSARGYSTASIEGRRRRAAWCRRKNGQQDRSRVLRPFEARGQFIALLLLVRRVGLQLRLLRTAQQ